VVTTPRLRSRLEGESVTGFSLAVLELPVDEIRVSGMGNGGLGLGRERRLRYCFYGEFAKSRRVKTLGRNALPEIHVLFMCVILIKSSNFLCFGFFFY
jgi:hypothetical protein